MVSKDLSRHVRFRGSRQTCKPHLHDPSMDPALPEDHFFKVLVSRQQYRTLVIGLLQDLVVCAARGKLGYVDDRVPFMPQSLYYWPINTLIGERVHADLLARG
jgi:hypothetical protein